MSNLGSRLLTAAVAAPLLLGLLYFLPWFAWGGFVALALTIACLEFFAMTHPEDRAARWVGTGFTLGLYALLTVSDFGARGALGWVLIALCVGVPLALLYTLFRPLDQKTAMLRMASLALAPMYLGVGFATNTLLARVHDEMSSRRIGAGFVVFSLMVAWLSDTGGYFAGKGIGGPKLYSSISPNKTWAGAIGGLGGSVVGALLAHFWFLPELPLGRGIAAALIAGALGQLGDLCESLMKRSVGVKDSGGILPGHGGMLDRVDALLFVSATLYAMQRAGWLIP
jgi:phosphatidate cytidylyltransferase